MPRKAKPTKHTSAELNRRAAASLQNKGGGAAGLADRKGGAAGHSKFLCSVCGVQAPSIASMKIHHDAKHDRLPWVPENYEDMQAKHGGTTQGVAIRGTTNSKKIKAKTTKTETSELLAAGLSGAKK